LIYCQLIQVNLFNAWLPGLTHFIWVSSSDAFESTC